MSDEWCPDHDGSHCYALRDLAERVSRLESGAVVSNERAILVDLIAELRAQHYADQCECGCEQWYECEPCSHISLCPTQEYTDRAEARLRELNKE